MNANEKLDLIRDMCSHPGAFHWSGRQMADAIKKVINEDEPIAYVLSDLDHPVPYELVHDAVPEEVEEQ